MRVLRVFVIAATAVACLTVGATGVQAKRPGSGPPPPPPPPPPSSWAAPFSTAYGSADAATGAIDVSVHSSGATSATSSEETLVAYEDGALGFTHLVTADAPSLSYEVAVSVDQLEASATVGSSQVHATLTLQGPDWYHSSLTLAESGLTPSEATAPGDTTWTFRFDRPVLAGTYQARLTVTASASGVPVGMTCCPTIKPCMGTWADPCPEQGDPSPYYWGVITTVEAKAAASLRVNRIDAVTSTSTT